MQVSINFSANWKDIRVCVGDEEITKEVIHEVVDFLVETGKINLDSIQDLKNKSLTFKKCNALFQMMTQHPSIKVIDAENKALFHEEKKCFVGIRAVTQSTLEIKMNKVKKTEMIDGKENEIKKIVNGVELFVIEQQMETEEKKAETLYISDTVYKVVSQMRQKLDQQRKVKQEVEIIPSTMSESKVESFDIKNSESMRMPSGPGHNCCVCTII
jgi:hypothetical protein